LGRAIIARAIASICCCPPDSCHAASLSRAASGDFEVFAHAHAGEDPPPLGHEGDAPARPLGGRQGGDIGTVECDVSGRRRQPHEAAQQARLAGAVSPQNGKAIAGFHGKGQRCDRGNTAIGDRQAGDAKQRRAHAVLAPVPK
jgi:hypothetical protein